MKNWHSDQILFLMFIVWYLNHSLISGVTAIVGDLLKSLGNFSSYISHVSAYTNSLKGDITPYSHVPMIFVLFIETVENQAFSQDFKDLIAKPIKKRYHFICSPIHALAVVLDLAFSLQRVRDKRSLYPLDGNFFENCPRLALSSICAWLLKSEQWANTADYQLNSLLSKTLVRYDDKCVKILKCYTQVCDLLKVMFCVQNYQRLVVFFFCFPSSADSQWFFLGSLRIVLVKCANGWRMRKQTSKHTSNKTEINLCVSNLFSPQWQGLAVSKGLWRWFGLRLLEKS